MKIAHEATKAQSYSWLFFVSSCLCVSLFSHQEIDRMVTLQTQLQPASSVLATTLSNRETVLLDLHSNYYYSLNETGAQIWQGLSQGLTPDAISHQLMASYAISFAEAEAAVLALLRDLTAENLVQPLATPVDRRTHG
jgi:hypothetical protein